MDWPFIDNTNNQYFNNSSTVGNGNFTNNFIVDYHLVYAGVLVTLIVTRAGHVFGLDAWAENLSFVKQHPAFKPLVA